MRHDPMAAGSMSEEQLKQQNPLITIYYWQQGFMLLAPSFMLERSRSPYRRLSATLMFAQRQAFSIETDEGGLVSSRALLLAPKVTRRQLIALDSDLVICDLAVNTPEFQALSPLLDDTPVRQLDAGLLAPLAAELQRARAGELSPDELRALLHGVIFQFSGRQPELPRMHPRLAKALQLIQEQSLRTITPAWLADQVHLSASRLRQLFSAQIGSSLTHYLRWNAVWKVAWLWSRGQPLGQIAEAVGFYDLAHLNRAFNEVFGLNPSTLFQPDQVRLIRCDWSESAS